MNLILTDPQAAAVLASLRASARHSGYHTAHAVVCTEVADALEAILMTDPVNRVDGPEAGAVGKGSGV